MSDVRYPEMRTEIVDAVRGLSDPEYQQRVWIQRRYPTPTFYDDISQTIHLLFDDSAALTDPDRDVGVILYPNETTVLRALGATLDPLIDQLDDAPDAAYLAHPRWGDVVQRAAEAYQVMHANDEAHGIGRTST